MSPEELGGTLRAFQECRILLTAIELNLFTALVGGATAISAAARTGCESQATEKLLNALVAMGLLEKAGDNFTNSPLAARLLVDGSPENERMAMLHDVERWNTWSTLTARVRGEVQPEDHRALSSDRHRALLAMLDRRSVERAPKLIERIGTAGVHRVLDVGGGSAAYSIAFVRAAEGIEADVFEVPEVVPITREYISRAGEEARVRVRAGDLRVDDLANRDSESGYDLILLFSLTHIFGEAENRSLLQRCYRALAPAGRIAIHDHILNEDKTHPRAGAVFAINMLVATRNGGTYSFAEYQRWLIEAGFSSIERRPLDGAPTAVLIATK